MRLFINAGGRGKRLGDLTNELPKPMVRVSGKPVLEHLINWAKSQPIKDVVVMEGYKASVIQEFFGNGDSFGIPIYHSVEAAPLGSGGAIKNALRFIDKTFAYISGDHLCDVNLTRIMDSHIARGADLTVLVHESSHPEDSDILKVGKDGRVLKFVQKGTWTKNEGVLSNSGLCIIEPHILSLMDREVFDFEGYIYPKILDANMRMFAYASTEFIADMGTPERLERCERYLKSKGEK